MKACLTFASSIVVARHQKNSFRPELRGPCRVMVRRTWRSRRVSTTAQSSLASDSREKLRFEDLFQNRSDANVLSPQNETVSLIEHVQARNAAGEAVLLGWLRHFGCSLCKKQTSTWQALRPQLEDCGKVCIILVGNGPSEHARDFKQEMKWEGSLFTDPNRVTYKAMQFRSDVLSTFNLPALRKVISSLSGGNQQTWSRIPTDAFQQGGAILVDADGIVRLFHADAFAGDQLGDDQLVQNVCAVARCED